MENNIVSQAINTTTDFYASKNKFIKDEFMERLSADELNIEAIEALCTVENIEINNKIQKFLHAWNSAEKSFNDMIGLRAMKKMKEAGETPSDIGLPTDSMEEIEEKWESFMKLQKQYEELEIAEYFKSLEG